MNFLSPWWLLGLIVVAGAALWALLRPTRRFVIVGSLKLWRKAFDALDRSSRRRSRRVSVSWVLLLVGAVGGVLAGARPVFYTDPPARRVAIAICPSVEIATENHVDVLRDAVRDLLTRLSPSDKVQLLYPMGLGVDGGWFSPGDAERIVSSGLSGVPFRSDECRFPQPSPGTQHLYRFVPGGMKLPAGPRTSIIELPTGVAPVTIDALAATELPDKKVQVFLAARNHTDSLRSVRITVQAVRPEEDPPGLGPQYTTEPITIRPKDRGQFVQICDAAAAFRVLLMGQEEDLEGLGSSGCLLRAAAVMRKVAIVGRDHPALRRFVRVDPTLTLVGEVTEADMVICNGNDPPSGIPAIVFDPPSAPGGWRRGSDVGPLVLGDADIAVDDPVMQHVDLGDVAVRQIAPWISGGAPPQKILAAYRADAIILRNAPAQFLDPDPPERRIYLTFSIAEENTNLSMTHAFVIFLANATRWLVPGGTERTAFGYTSPSRAFPLERRSWKYLSSDLTDSTWEVVSGFRGPGVYRVADPDSPLLAVSLVGLRRAIPKLPPRNAVASLPLPEPVAVAEPVEFWPWLVLGAMTLWILGWIFRAR